VEVVEPLAGGQPAAKDVDQPVGRRGETHFHSCRWLVASGGSSEVGPRAGGRAEAVEVAEVL
jgi:hypothetical protein